MHSINAFDLHALAALTQCRLVGEGGDICGIADLETATPQDASFFPHFATFRQGEMSSGDLTMLRIGIVNTKTCVDNSKLGKQEQTNFEEMKSSLKGKALEDIESRLSDDDDTLTDEAASELKRKKRVLRNGGVDLEGQYMQVVQQTSLKSSQWLTKIIGKASTQVAQGALSTQPIDVTFTDETCPFYSPPLGVSDRIIAKMNAIFETEQKEPSSKHN